MNYSKLSSWKTYREYWGQTSIPTISTGLPTRSLCSQRGCKTRLLHQRLLLWNSRRTGNLKFQRHFHGAPTDFSLPLGRRRTNFARPRRTKTSKATGTYSTPASFTTSEFPTTGPDAVSLPEVLPWYNHSLVPLTVRRRKRTQSRQAHISLTIDLRMLSLQDSMEHRRISTWCYRWWPQSQKALSNWTPRRNSSV